MTLPDEYLKKMKNLLQDDFDKYINCFNETSYSGLRANTLKITPTELKKILPFSLSSVPWCDTGFYFDKNDRPAKNFYYNAGLFYIQEPSAMSTSAILPIKEGDRVLDICAAPGGKSTQIAAKLNNTGLLVANDISNTRCKALAKNIEISGIKNAIITNESPKNLAIKFAGYFNKIIIDAPCSGEGMFRKDKNAIKSWQIHKTDSCTILQKEILYYAKKMLAKDGIIAYSTCTFAPEENEQMIHDFLQQNTDFELIDFDKTTGFEDGRASWLNHNDLFNIKKTGRLMPYNIKGEGHFLALLKRTSNAPSTKIKQIEKVDNKQIIDLQNFFKEYLNIDLYKNLKIYKSSVFSVPNAIDLSGLRIIKNGFYLGELKKNRFEPSWALAMALKKEEAKYTISFNIDDKNLVRYLKCESFLLDIKTSGWHLVCIGNFPIGWAKVQNGRLKNKYLPSFRI